jgi:hypothetical protein
LRSEPPAPAGPETQIRQRLEAVASAHFEIVAEISKFRIAVSKNPENCGKRNSGKPQFCGRFLVAEAVSSELPPPRSRVENEPLLIKIEACYTLDFRDVCPHGTFSDLSFIRQLDAPCRSIPVTLELQVYDAIYELR